jgi:hypothetical protein
LKLINKTKPGQHRKTLAWPRRTTMTKTGYECERCDGDGIFVPETTLLAGVYRAKLCNRCANEWEAFMRPHELWQKKLDVNARGTMILALTEADAHDRTAELQEVTAEDTAVHLELFAVAEQWMKDV